jgi:O-antigen/teichoic acid export membrane protein
MSVNAAVAAQVRARPRPALAGAWLVSAATLASGVLTYAFHVVAARSLGAEAYGRVAVLWAAMFLAAIVLYRPVEQTVSRALADRLARGEETRSVLRSAGIACAVVVCCAVAACIAAEGPIARRLFGGEDELAWMLAAGVAFYGVAYLVRGVLGGMRWFGGYALAYVVDTAGRLALALPLVLVASTSLAGLAVVAGGVVGIALPLALGRRRLRALAHDGPGKPFALRSAAGFALPAAVIAAADQLLVNGAPLLVVLDGGAQASKAAGVVFAATMLVRVPVFVFQGLAASLLPNLTHLHARGDGARFRRAVATAAGMLLAAGVVIVACAAAFGPEALRLVYGDEFDAGRGALALLGAGVACYLAAATVSQALLARANAARAAGAWAISAVAFTGLYAVAGGGILMRIATAFTTATLLALVLLVAVLVREARR